MTRGISRFCLILGFLCLTNAISVRFVTARLTSVFVEVAREKRASLMAGRSVATADEPRQAALSAVFEVEKRMALCEASRNLAATSDVLILAGVVAGAVGIYGLRHWASRSQNVKPSNLEA
jgi:hypothetical protein